MNTLKQLEENIEGITALEGSVIPNNLTFCAARQHDTFDLEMDSAHGFILGALDKIALEWHKNTIGAPYEPS